MSKLPHLPHLPHLQPAARMERLVRRLEAAGNRLPHPFVLFTGLAVGILLLSALLSALGAAATVTVVPKGGGVPSVVTVPVRDLITTAFLRDFLTKFVSIYADFPPLGLTMAMMLGIGVVEQSGLMSALMRRTLLGASPYMVTAMLTFVGINANLASGAGVIFTPTIGAALFKALGRNPWLGVAVGYAAASGGFTANLLVAGTDVLLAGITETAAKGLHVAAPVHPLMNWYFMIAATFVVTFTVTLVAERVLTRLLPDPSPDPVDPGAPASSSEVGTAAGAGTTDTTVEASTGAGASRDHALATLQSHAVTEDERRGLRWAGVAALSWLVAILGGAIPAAGVLRNAKGGFLPESPLTEGSVALLFFLFFMTGTAFAYGARRITSSREIPKLMEGGLRGIMGFLVVVLPAAIFIHFFNESRIATLLAAQGASWIREFELGGLPLLLMFILVVTVVNIFMTSGSAKWLILAPVFIPMFATADLSPAATQVAYRIGDSATNIISPIKSYLPVIIGLLEQYRRDANRPVGIGTVIALEFPFAVALLISLTLLLTLWYLLGLPLGPGAPMTM